MPEYLLGRRTPETFEHVVKYPFAAAAPFELEMELGLPAWHQDHNQNGWNGCVGWSGSMMMSILNGGVRYDETWLWNNAKANDEWADTNPGDNNGTSVNAACKVLKAQGHVLRGQPAPSLNEGISEYRWARNADEVRAGLSARIPVDIGVNWYQAFDNAETINGEYWIGRGSSWGVVRGGHAVCLYAGSDARQAVKIKNSWPGYPEVWLPYASLNRLLGEYGEALIVTDRGGAQPGPLPPSPEGRFFTTARSWIFHRRGHRGLQPTRWFQTWWQAYAAGLRPCGLCRPSMWGARDDDDR